MVTMPIYKDADALRKAMYHEAFEKDTDMQKWDSGCWIRYKMFENAIDNAPTIDVPDRKVGEWKHGYCSECEYNWGKDAPIASVPNFCPNCGARMFDKDTNVRSKGADDAEVH